MQARVEDFHLPTLKYELLRPSFQKAHRVGSLDRFLMKPSLIELKSNTQLFDELSALGLPRKGRMSGRPFGVRGRFSKEAFLATDASGPDKLETI
jgi:hypothetical protein